ncbi:MAG: hypothetical protein HYY00_00400 [Chloroflexi bacterium]|nr:hypothetical protein [Chloroflexota bacterium]
MVGTVLAGGVAELGADDGSYFQIEAARRDGQWSVDWYGYGVAPEPRGNILSLSATLDGHFSTDVGQQLYAYNFSTAAWDLVDTRQVGTGDVTATWSTRDVGRYIDGATGHVRLRVRATNSWQRFNAFADLMGFAVTSGGGPQVDVFPSSVTLDRGTIIGGTTQHLTSDDGAHLQIDSVRRDSRWQTDWYGTATTNKPVNQIARLTFTYNGANTAEADQDVYVWNFDTLAWEPIGHSEDLGTQEATVTWATANVDPYISAGGELRVRVRADSWGRYAALADLMRVRLQLFPPDIEVAPLHVEEMLIQGQSSTRTVTISNPGFSDLEFSITEEAPPPPVEPAPGSYTPEGKGGEPSEYGPITVTGSGGPDSFGYRWIDSDEPRGPAFNWVEISSSGNWAGTISNCDDCYQQLPIGFNFSFYGTNYSQLWASSNGLLSVTASSIYSNTYIPNTNSPNGFIAPFWDDLYTSSAGDVYYQTLGTAPNRRFVVEWKNVDRCCGTSDRYTFQAILEEGTNRILLQYQTLSGTYANGSSASIGIEDQNGTVGLGVSVNAPYLHNGLAILFSTTPPVPPWLSFSPTEGAVPPGGSANVAVTLDSTPLEPGVHQAFLVIHSNDADEDPVNVLVTFRVVLPEPPVSAGPDVTINEAQTFDLAATFTDPAWPSGHTATISWGDGASGPGTLDEAARTVTGSHVYADNGTYTVTVSVLRNGGSTGSDSLVASVYNVPPSVNAGADQTADVGQVVNVVATFTDPGWLDTFTAAINWGDGTTSMAIIAITQVGHAAVPTQGTVSGSHVYAVGGTYVATVSVWDDDTGQGSDALVVTATAHPFISLNPTSGPGGTVATVTGSQFTPNETSITVTWDGAAVNTTPAVIVAGPTGDWQATFVVPTDLAWTAQTSGIPEGLTLWGVDFVDASIGWAVGPGNIILHTANGGATWTTQASGTIQDLWDVDFVDASNGWAVGNNGTIRHTTDGGANWTAQTSTTLSSLLELDFVDASNGWAVGVDGTIVHTTDGGATWSPQSSGTTLHLRGVDFVDASNGWAVGFDANVPNGTIIHTTDGGANWTAQTSGATLLLRDVRFLDASNGWAVGVNGMILHTANGGATWTAQTSGTIRDLWDVDFIDIMQGWAVGEIGTIRHTTDGGANWSTQSTGAQPNHWAVDFVDAGNGWVVGSGVVSGGVFRASLVTGPHVVDAYGNVTSAATVPDATFNVTVVGGAAVSEAPAPAPQPTPAPQPEPASLDLGPGLAATEGSQVSLPTPNAQGMAPAALEQLTVDWGDGTVETVASGATHAYGAPGTYTVTVCTTGAPSVCGTTTVTVSNVAPSVSAQGPAPVSEGTGPAVQVTATFSDPGWLSTHIAVIYWGDGQSQPVQPVITALGGPGTPQTGSVSASHLYSQGANYPVQVCVTDNFGGRACDSVVATVLEQAPAVNAGSNLASLAGQSVALTATFYQAVARSLYAATIDWGDGITETAPAGSTGNQGAVLSSHTYAAPGTYSVQVCVQDDRGNAGCDTTTVVVQQLPVGMALSLGQAQVQEGAAASVTVTVTNLPPDQQATVTLAWGDGSSESHSLSPTGGSATLTASHAYGDNGTYTIKACLDGGAQPACATASVSVVNAAPEITGQRLVVRGLVAAVSVSFRDAGWLDTHTATISWGDGSVTAASTVTLDAGSLAVGSHAYAAPGTYTATVCVADDDGGKSCTQLQVQVTGEMGYPTPGSLPGPGPKPAGVQE